MIKIFQEVKIEILKAMLIKEIKKKLKELQPKVNPDSGGKKIDPKFFNKDVIDDLPKKRPE